MELRHLQYLLTIAEEGSLLAASQKLFLSPSALSQLVTRLENELKTPLFRRTRRGIVPTYAGKLYLEMANEIVLRERKACLQISDIAENRVGHFTVGVTPGRGTQMFASVFPKFKALYPDMRVSLFEGTVREINELIAEAKVDIGFVTNAILHTGVETRYQATERIVLAVPKTHPMAVRAASAADGDFPEISLSNFREDEFLMAGMGTTLRAMADRALLEAGFTPNIIFETESISTLHALATSGFGLSFIPEFYTKGSSGAVYFKTEPAISWDLLAASKKDGYVTRAEEDFISLVTEYYHSN